MDLLAPANAFLRLVDLVLLALSVWALVDASLRPAASYVAAGKLTKPAWVAITAICVALGVIGADLLGFFGFVIAVAVIVYLVDVRPAVRDVRPGGSWR